MSKAVISIYNDGPKEISYRSLDLLWRPVGMVVRFVFVIHPTKGSAIFMSTDISLIPLEMIKIYRKEVKRKISAYHLKK
jgi:hypothetical protein